jgi:putative ABC transport system ATP-binding protein
MAAPDPDESSALVACREVTKRYERGGSRFSRGGETVTALRGVSLAVGPNEVVGIAGPSGSGKSTLLHLLAALDTPTTGSVTLAGEETGDLSAGGRARRRLSHVGLVFQRFHLLPSLSARANVALPLVEQGVGKRERRERAVDLLEAVGLGDRATHRPGALSGGEQQRVALARALVTDPALVVADEPTGELDTETGTAVLDLLAGADAEDRGVVIASHDERALACTDRVIHLRDGRRVER